MQIFGATSLPIIGETSVAENEAAALAAGAPKPSVGFISSLKQATPYVLGFSGLSSAQYAAQLGQYGLPINPIGIGEVFLGTAAEGYAVAGAFSVGANFLQRGVAAVKGGTSISDLQTAQITSISDRYHTFLGRPVSELAAEGPRLTKCWRDTVHQPANTATT